jgi:hypothetical protein
MFLRRKARVAIPLDEWPLLRPLRDRSHGNAVGSVAHAATFDKNKKVCILYNRIEAPRPR